MFKENAEKPVAMLIGQCHSMCKELYLGQNYLIHLPTSAFLYQPHMVLHLQGQHLTLCSRQTPSVIISYLAPHIRCGGECTFSPLEIRVCASSALG